MSYDSSEAIRSVGGSELPASAASSPFQDGEDYATAQSEVAKLVDANAQGGVDWTRVVRASASILDTQAKDLTVTAWLVLGCLQVRGLPGLADGLHVLRDVITGCWDVMTPSVARLRGRRNQLEWLADRLELVLANEPSRLEPIDPAMRSRMADDWSAIEAFWSARDDEAPPFQRVRRLLDNLPELEPAVAPETSSAVQNQAGPVAPDTTRAAPLPASPAPAPAPASSLTALVAVPTVAGGDGIAAQAAQWLDGGAAFIADCLERFPEAWLPYRLNRMLAWATLDLPLLAAGGGTRVPPPSDTALEALQAIVASGNPLAIARYCESRLTAFPFWLDLCWHCAQALHTLGHHAAAAVVKTDTAAFVARAPGLACATFADGSPFLIAPAREWLAVAPVVAATGNADGAEEADDGHAAVFAEARAAAVNGRLGDGLQQIESLVRRQRGGRERFRLRLAQCELVRAHGAPDVLRYLVDGLVADIDAHGLGHWEPELAGPALALAALAPAQPAISERDRTLTALARVDLAQAWRLLSAK